MNKSLNFEKLVDSLTEQQREKSSLEVAIKRCDAERKSHDNALSAARFKEESLQRQIPEIKLEIGKQSALRFSMQSELGQQKKSSCTLLNNVVHMKSQVNDLQGFAEKEVIENAQLVKTAEVKYSSQLKKLREICERL